METPKLAEFKQRVQMEWAGDVTANAWQKYYPQMREQLAGVTKALVDAAAPGPRDSILDLASGTGEPAISLARRVPDGSVVASDLSEGMLTALRFNAANESITNIETRVCDGQALPFADSSFDLVTSRFGVMFFVEIERAMAEIRRVLKPGGRAVFLVWGAPVPGSYFGAAAMPYIRRLAIKPDPDAPGPMRYAEPGKLAKLVEAAGFTGVIETAFNLPAPAKGAPEAFLTGMFEIAAPFRNAAASLPESDRQAAQEEALENLRALFDGSIINVTAPIIIVTAISN
jgi:SAM-dependent methyltransferase